MSLVFAKKLLNNQENLTYFTHNIICTDFVTEMFTVKISQHTVGKMTFLKIKQAKKKDSNMLNLIKSALSMI